MFVLNKKQSIKRSNWRRHKLGHTWLVMSRLDTTRHVRLVERVDKSVLSRAVRQARRSQNAWARHVERAVSCRDVTWRAKWNLGLAEKPHSSVCFASNLMNMPNRWCVNYTGCRFNTELTTRWLCWHTRLWTRLYHGTSASASTAASTHGHYARRLRHCSSNRSLAPTSRNVHSDVPRRLSGTHFLRLASEATHCLFSNLG